MKEKRLLYAIGWVKDSYIEEMNQPGKRAKRVPSRKLWLIAAILALMLLLVGCAAVFLWMQERSIGQVTYTQRFDAQGHYIEPTEKTMDTVTLFGSSGSDMQKALAEWLEFKENYPDFSELNLTDEDAEKIPERYHYTYGCYTVEMVNALEEIAAKYNLTLLDTEIHIQRYQYETALEGLGLTSLLRPEGGVTMENGQGFVRPPQNFYMEFLADMPEQDTPWAKDIHIEYSYAQAGYFTDIGATTLDLTEYEQWKYTSADGTPLLLALNQKGQGIILAEREDSVIYLLVNSNFWGPNFPDPEDVIDWTGLEKLADAFDYSIQPQPVDMEVLQPKLDADQKAYDERMQEAVTTYAGFTEFLLENAHYIPTRHYAFYDLDGDGAEEMLLGGPGVEFTRILHNEQGSVHEHMWSSEFRILENGGYMTYTTYSGEEGTETSYNFYPPMANGNAMLFDYSGNGPQLRHEDFERTVTCKNGVWKTYTALLDTGTVLQESEAQAIIAQYPEQKLDWQPVWDYPIDASGRTIGDELSSRKLPQTEMEYIQFYGEAAEKKKVWLSKSHTHFALLDMNDDGIRDLLLSSDGTSADLIFTWKYGGAVSMGGYFSYLCEGNVMCLEEIRSADDGADLHRYTFTQFDGNTEVTLADIQQNKASGVWTDMTTGETISGDAAQNIIHSHPEIAIDFRPVEELTK